MLPVRYKLKRELTGNDELELTQPKLKRPKAYDAVSPINTDKTRPPSKQERPQGYMLVEGCAKCLSAEGYFTELESASSSAQSINHLACGSTKTSRRHQESDLDEAAECFQDFSYSIFGPAGPKPVDNLGFNPHPASHASRPPSSTGDGDAVSSVALPLILHTRSAASANYRELSQGQPPNPGITAATRSLLELFAEDETLRRNGLVDAAGSKHQAEIEAARIMGLMGKCWSMSRAKICCCFGCKGYLVRPGHCLWGSD